MFDSFGLAPDNFINSSKSFAAYQRQAHLLNPSRIPEAFLLRTGAIAQGETKIISLAGIPFDFQLLSVWAWMPNATSSDSMTVTILYSGVEQTVFSIAAADVPWEPPFNILGADHTIEVVPTRPVSSLSLFIHQAKLLDVEVV